MVKPSGPAHPGPTVAELRLHDGATIRCLIVEDPELDEAGLRVFWLEPVRPLDPGEQILSVFLDVLPGRSTARLRWPGLT